MNDDNMRFIPIIILIVMLMLFSAGGGAVSAGRRLDTGRGIRRADAEEIIQEGLYEAAIASVGSGMKSFSAADYPTVSARAAILYQPDTGEAVFEKNADKRLPMASTTKIMTALIVLEMADDLSEAVTVDHLAAGTEGSSAYLKAGEELTVEELLYALLLRSANDAAMALAIHFGGSVEGFLDLMNRRAQEMGLVDTHFDNPHGLDSEEHYTTARELAIIAAEALRCERFVAIASTKSKSYAHSEITRTYYNHNKLLGSLDGCIGMKTGYTKRCGRCLVSATEREGLSFIAVTLDAPNDWRDHRELTEYGYSRLMALSLIEPYEYRYEPSIIGGETESSSVTNTEGLKVILPRGEHKVVRSVNSPRYLIAPLEVGESVGSIAFTVDGKAVGEVAIRLTEEIKEKQTGGFFDKLLSIFK